MVRVKVSSWRTIVKRNQTLVDLSAFEYLTLGHAQNVRKEILVEIRRVRKATPTTPASSSGAPIRLSPKQTEELVRALREMNRFLPRTTGR